MFLTFTVHNLINLRNVIFSQNFIINMFNVTRKNGSYLISKYFKRNLNKTNNAQQIEAVNMAYASYENTKNSESTPLVIMHGLFGSKGNWNSLSKALQQRTNPQRKIIAVDARNHGDSPHTEFHSYEHLVEDIHVLLQQMNIKTVSLLGHSMGGRAVMLYALKYPKLVDKLIVADISPVKTSPGLLSMPSIFQALKSVELPSNIPISTARQKADIQLSKTINNKGVRAFLLTNLVQKDDKSYTWRINVEALQKNFKQYIVDFPKITNLQYTGPVLFIAGSTSDYVQKSDHPEILKLFPKAEIKYIEGAGHWVHSEKPKEFLEIALEFLNIK